MTPGTCSVGLANGGDLQTVGFAKGVTAAQVLQSAKVEPGNGDQVVLVNGKPVNPESTPVQQDDTILVSQPIEGG